MFGRITEAGKDCQITGRVDFKYVVRTGIGNVQIAGAILGHGARSRYIGVWPGGWAIPRRAPRNRIDRVLSVAANTTAANKKKKERSCLQKTSHRHTVGTAFKVHELIYLAKG